MYIACVTNRIISIEIMQPSPLKFYDSLHMYRYELMLSCWNEDLFAHPSFKRARQHLDQVISSTEEVEEYLHLISAELMDDSYNIKF